MSKIAKTKHLTLQQRINERRLKDMDRLMRRAVANKLKESGGAIDHKTLTDIAWTQAWYATENLKNKNNPTHREARKLALVKWALNNKDGYQGKAVPVVIRDEAIRVAALRKKNTNFSVALDSPDAVKQYMANVAVNKNKILADIVKKRELNFNHYEWNEKKGKFVYEKTLHVKLNDKNGLTKSDINVTKESYIEIASNASGDTPLLAYYSKVRASNSGFHDDPYIVQVHDQKTGLPVIEDEDRFTKELINKYNEEKQKEDADKMRFSSFGMFH